MGDVIAFRPRPVDPAPESAPEAQASRRSAAASRPAPLPADPKTPTHGVPLWREVAGAVLREERLRQQRTLAHVAERAGMSVQHLSEVERGRKEASSEMLAAACGSLGLGLAHFAQRCAHSFARVSTRPTGPVLFAA